MFYSFKICFTITRWFHAILYCLNISMWFKPAMMNWIQFILFQHKIYLTKIKSVFCLKSKLHVFLSTIRRISSISLFSCVFFLFTKLKFIVLYIVAFKLYYFYLITPFQKQNCWLIININWITQNHNAYFDRRWRRLIISPKHQ